MKGDNKTLEFLNSALSNEFMAINQYFLHSRILKNWGISKLAKFEYDSAMEEMLHADMLIERILFLEGMPQVGSLVRPTIGSDVAEILEHDLRLEWEAVETLKVGIQHCEAEMDYVSKDLLKSILAGEEDHVDYLETQLELIKRTGIQNYIALQSGIGTVAGDAE